jgi:signal transduction histidine kinase
MFDGPYGPTTPHLHVDPRGFDPRFRLTVAAAIYDHTGSAIAWYPRPSPYLGNQRVVPGKPDDPPEFHTRPGLHQAKRERVLRVTVPHASGELYVLELVASLDHVDHSVRAFYETTLGIALALALVLALVHTVHARQLSSRVRRLSDHMKALREGNLTARPPHDTATDEIAELSGVVAEATERLREARGAQERLIADAAHELRTPLTLVRTSVDVALRRRRTATELEESLRVVRGEVDRVARLATRLLDLAAAGQGAWDRIPGDVAEVAREAVEAAVPSAEERGILLEVLAPAPVPLSFHAGSLRQAIDNLLTNAVKFSPEGGSVKVRVHTLDGGGARVEVSDEGPGIPDDERERVFEPFHRVAPSPGGAGLGLAIVREIATKHGGRAWVAPARGKGATVVMELPGEALRLRAHAG